MKQITIEYLIKGASDFEHREIPIEEYFDPLEDGEVLEIDSNSKFLHPYQYVTNDTSKLVFLNLKITFEEDTIEFKQTFWNDGENIVTERIDSGKHNYRVIIVSSKIAVLDNYYETMRFVFNDNKIFPVYHSFITTNPDGTENKPLNLDLKQFTSVIYKY